MLIQVDEIVKRTAALMDDPGMDSYDRDYCLPFINQNWDEMNVRLAILGLEFTEDVQVLANVPAGTASLAAFQVAGQALQYMWKPANDYAVEWKMPGEPDTAYRKARKVDVLPDVSADSEGILAWEWRQETIFVTPSSVDVDIRVRFQAMSTTVSDPTDKVYRGTLHLIAASTAAMMWAVRGNDRLAERMDKRAQTAQEEFEVLCVMADQGKTRRVGRMSRRGNGRQWFRAQA